MAARCQLVLWMYHS